MNQHLCFFMVPMIEYSHYLNRLILTFAFTISGKKNDFGIKPTFSHLRCVRESAQDLTIKNTHDYCNKEYSLLENYNITFIKVHIMYILIIQAYNLHHCIPEAFRSSTLYNPLTSTKTFFSSAPFLYILLRLSKLMTLNSS